MTRLGIWYSRRSSLDLIGYTDSDWAGCCDDRRSTTGGCCYLGNNLISWYSKKQNVVALSTAEAEYVAASCYCTQLIWMRQMLDDYGIHKEGFLVLCNNTSAISISKNPVHHSRSKHIDIRYHFIRDLVEDNVCNIEHIGMSEQLTDILTKPMESEKFERLRKGLGLYLQ